ncbi:hypothetical protein TorRG33x02_326870, partial [Trema orientale]
MDKTLFWNSVPTVNESTLTTFPNNIVLMYLDKFRSKRWDILSRSVATNTGGTLTKASVFSVKE